MGKAKPMIVLKDEAKKGSLKSNVYLKSNVFYVMRQFSLYHLTLYQVISQTFNILNVH